MKEKTKKSAEEQPSGSGAVKEEEKDSGENSLSVEITVLEVR